MKVTLIKTAARMLILFLATLTISYFLLRIQLINVSPYFIVFSILLVIAEMYTIFHFLNALYAFWPRKYEKYRRINFNKNLTINMLICVCGEPAELVRETILAAKKTAEVYSETVHPYTKPRIIVINDGLLAGKENWVDVLNLAKELEVGHIARKSGGGFKAGNLNNALNRLPTNDPHNTIDIVFDADFAALPKFLKVITKPFVNDTVDFIQTPQRYKNERTWVAKASGSHQINFFDHYCAAKAHDNALFLCGTNFAMRRSALNAVNGFDTRFITEDYATSLNLHLNGKRGIFIKEPLAEGAAPSTLKAYFKQQQRWAKGTFDTSFVYLPQILFGPLTLKQKMHYIIASTYYFIGVRDFILVLGPLPYLFFNVPLVQPAEHSILLYLYLPIIGFNFFSSIFLVRSPIKSLVLNLISFPVFFSAFISSVFKQKLGFVVTIKKYEKENVFVIYRTQLIVGLLLLIGITYNQLVFNTHEPSASINYFWTAYDILCITIGFILMIQENYISRLDEFAYSKFQDKVTKKLSFKSLIPFSLR
jgi:cellulose synthase (UDP-forming)